jgi:TrmH family RNA methyltransferase
MKLEDVKKLHQKKYRSLFGYYLVEGEHLILELQKAASTESRRKDITLYVTQEYEHWAQSLHLNVSIITLNARQMAQISNTKSPQGIVACVPLPVVINNTSTSNTANQQERCVYLHEVQDPGNLGTIIRTLAWFGHFRLLLSSNSVDPFNPKVVRASMGAIFHVPIELDVHLDDLQTRFNNFAYLDMKGDAITSEKFGRYECYLFGNEARGVPSDALLAFNADAYTINGSGQIDSLNLASAVNICAYQLSLKI